MGGGWWWVISFIELTRGWETGRERERVGVNVSLVAHDEWWLSSRYKRPRITRRVKGEEQAISRHIDTPVKFFPLCPLLLGVKHRTRERSNPGFLLSSYNNVREKTRSTKFALQTYKLILRWLVTPF